MIERVIHVKEHYHGYKLDEEFPPVVHNLVKGRVAT
jgi:hypothetical protein